MSVRYSPIAPLPILEQLQGQGILGNYLLLLAHEVLKDPHGYIALVENLTPLDLSEDPERFVILDNGVIERGTPVSVGELLEAANIIEADCVAAPDVIGDMAATKRLIMDQGHLISRDFPIMRIPQGECVSDLFSCVDWLNTYLPTQGNDPMYWGIPRWIANTLSTRVPVIDYINTVCPKPRIHLLGMSQHLRDDQRSLLQSNVMGVDSANPIVMGLKGVRMHLGDWTHLDRDDYWDRAVLHAISAANVEFMHNAVRS